MTTASNDRQCDPMYPSSRSDYSLKSDLSFLSHNTGSWSVKNGVATVTWPRGSVARYNQESLELAIQNVKNNRSVYVTYDDYRAHLCQLQSGLSMLIAANNA
jgi:5-keto 4-deoxyuronate isomerase